MSKKSEAAIEKARNAIAAKFGNKVMRLASEPGLSDIKEVIPTGSEVLDKYILGCGGLPAGRIGEIHSDEGAGKTSLGFQLLAAAQRAGGMAVLIETERSLVRERMPIFGVDIESLLLYEPENLEELVNGLNEVLTLLPKNVGPNVVVWDSLAATELEGQLEKGVGKSAFVGKRARIMSETLPLLGRLARDHRCAVVVINQLRDKIGVVFGDSTTTPGGHALKFHSSWRFRLWRGAQTRANGAPAGMYTTIKAVKNKVGLPFRKAKFKLDFETGWDTNWALLNLGKDQKILPNKALATEKNLNQVREALGFGGIVTPGKGSKKPRKKVVEPDPGGPESRIDDSVLLDDGWPDDSPDGDDDGEE